MESALNSAVRNASPRAPVAGDGCFHVDEEAADDEIGHGVNAVWKRWYAFVPSCSAHSGTVKYHEGDCRSDHSSRSSPTASVHQHRGRLLEGMAIAVASKGYADTTIADIVREASVSRRTFYEHFATKADCLVALYEAASHNALKVLRGAIDPTHGWEAQMEGALRAYLELHGAAIRC